uniref:Uncharacterized protein n=1 Tax=Zonotrichia albicollis TaxID=44394 RepID=A0A8D2NCP8_ZONAL
MPRFPAVLFPRYPAVLSLGTQLCHPRVPSCAIPGTQLCYPWVPSCAIPRYPAVLSLGTQLCHAQASSCAISGTPGHGITRTSGHSIPRHLVVPSLGHLTMASPGHLAEPLLRHTLPRALATASPEHLAVLSLGTQTWHSWSIQLWQPQALICAIFRHPAVLHPGHSAVASLGHLAMALPDTHGLPGCAILRHPRAALESPRKSIIFEPYPSVVDPNDPKTLAFNPKKKNYERLQKALDSVMSIREMTQVSVVVPQPHVTSPVWDPSWEWRFGADLHLPMAGWVLGDPPAPCLASARGLTWRSRSRWTSWTPWHIPSCSGKAEGCAALSCCPLSLPLSHIPQDMGWSGGSQVSGAQPPHHLSFGGGHKHLTISGQVGTTFSDSPPLPPPLPKDNLQQQIPHCQAASQQGKGPG